MLYKWDQNNSGGGFDSNDKLCHRVVIEANTLQEAEQKAFSMGIYYDGCSKGLDCDCCGDRWYEPDEVTIESLKDWKRYGVDSIDSYFQYLADKYGGWTNPEIRVFYKDGSIKEYFGS